MSASSTCSDTSPFTPCSHHNARSTVCRACRVSLQGRAMEPKNLVGLGWGWVKAVANHSLRRAVRGPLAFPPPPYSNIFLQAHTGSLLPSFCPHLRQARTSTPPSSPQAINDTPEPCPRRFDNTIHPVHRLSKRSIWTRRKTTLDGVDVDEAAPLCSTHRHAAPPLGTGHGHQLSRVG